jgi:hypothetical protein
MTMSGPLDHPFGGEGAKPLAPRAPVGYAWRVVVQLAPPTNCAASSEAEIECCGNEKRAAPGSGPPLRAQTGMSSSPCAAAATGSGSAGASSAAGVPLPTKVPLSPAFGGGSRKATWWATT